jgi:hypothetical protein
VLKTGYAQKAFGWKTMKLTVTYFTEVNKSETAAVLLLSHNIEVGPSSETGPFVLDISLDETFIDRKQKYA